MSNNGNKGKPLVALFGPTTPKRTGPYGRLGNVVRIPLPCAPCMKSTCHFEKPMECLRAISPGVVAQRVAEVYSRKQAIGATFH